MFAGSWTFYNIMSLVYLLRKNFSCADRDSFATVEEWKRRVQNECGEIPMGRQGSHTQFYAFHRLTVSRETQIVHQTRILAIVKNFPSVPKRMVYFRENRK